MNQLEDSFLNEEQKDKKWKYVIKTLLPQKPIIPEKVPWINQAMLDWNVQVL